LTMLNKTKKQLEELHNPFIGIQLKSGGKIFGNVVKFTPHTIYVTDRHGEVLDVSRNHIFRAFLLIKGDITDGPTELSKQSKFARHF